VRGIYLGM